MCWDFFKRGRCPRKNCKYSHGEAIGADGEEAVGAMEAGPNDEMVAAYVFNCANATQQECMALRLFGSPDRELAQMRSCIQPFTELFLLNIQSLCLLGPFAAAGLPTRNIAPGAFGGKFNAQLHVAPLDSAVWEVSLEGRIPAGPKSAEELRELKVCFQQGHPAHDEVQRAWFAEAQEVAEVQGPPLKLPRFGKICSGKGGSKGSKPLPVLRRPKLEVEVGEAGSEEVGEDGEEMLKDPKSNLCWDHVAGKCPRGEGCRYKHLDGSAAGYIFHCNNATQGDCEANQLLGSPQRELQQMKHCIQQDTQLFLLNLNTKCLIGAFVVAASPDRHVVPEAFGGKFSAQVRVLPMDSPLLTAQLKERIPTGPVSADELESLRSLLEQGEATSPEVMEAWGIV